MSKIFNTFKAFTLTTGFLLIVLISLIAFSSRFDLPGGFRAYSVLTGSMEPVIQTGSLIVTSFPTSLSHIRTNSVITFEEPGYENKFITHRVNKIVDSKPGVVYQTKGDANNSPDPWLITYGRIKGVYLMHFPYLGTLLEFIRSPLGIIIFVVIPVLFIVLDESKNIVSALADIKIEKERKSKDHETKLHSYIWIIALPIIGLTIGQTKAIFFSSPVSLNNNTLTVAQASPLPSATPSPAPSSSPTPSVSPQPSSSPTATPSASPSSSPTPSASPSGGGTTVIIEGNGSGSNNTVNAGTTQNCTTTQTNNSNISFNIDSTANSGGNNNSGNTGNNENSNTGDSSTSVNVTITGGSNSSNGCP